jgi:hypothetical protein
MDVIIPYILNLSDITSKICIVTMFVILDLQNVFMNNVYVCLWSIFIPEFTC